MSLKVADLYICHARKYKKNKTQKTVKSFNITFPRQSQQDMLCGNYFVVCFFP